MKAHKVYVGLTKKISEVTKIQIFVFLTKNFEVKSHKYMIIPITQIPYLSTPAIPARFPHTPHPPWFFSPYATITEYYNLNSSMSSNTFTPNFKPIQLCVRYEPPVIGIVYKKKQTDTKKRIYTILLQKLVFNPDPVDAAKQLYAEHPHILNEKLIPVAQIAQLIKKIQAVTNADAEDFEEEQYAQLNKKDIFKNKNYQFHDDEFDDEDDHPQLNHSR